MLDILGFADRVSRDSEIGGLDSYIRTVLDVAQAHAGLRVILFSDTVVLYTLDDSPEAFDEVIEATSQVSYSLLAAEVPLRGAIAHGPFARSENDMHGSVIAGRPIIEAHYYEAQLQWVGVMLAPSVLRKVPDLASRGVVSRRRSDEDRDRYFARARREARVQRCPGIPVEPVPGVGVSYLEGFAVVPLSGSSASLEELLQCMSENLAKLRWLKQLAPDPRSQAKYQNSIAWLQPLYHQWSMRFQ